VSSCALVVWAAAAGSAVAFPGMAACRVRTVGRPWAGAHLRPGIQIEDTGGIRIVLVRILAARSPGRSNCCRAGRSRDRVDRVRDRPERGGRQEEQLTGDPAPPANAVVEACERLPGMITGAQIDLSVRRRLPWRSTQVGRLSSGKLPVTAGYESPCSQGAVAGQRSRWTRPPASPLAARGAGAVRPARSAPRSA